MDFIPETRLVLNELARNGDTEVAVALLELAAHVQSVACDLVALSLSLSRAESGHVFTLVAPGLHDAGPDDSRYVDVGSSFAASAERNLQASASPAEPDDVLDERRWAADARATAAEGIASTLSLPLVVDGQTVGGVDLYASIPDAFEGVHEALAGMLGTEAGLAVANADLGFATRSGAKRTAKRFAEEELVEIAVGIIAEQQHVDHTTARTRLSSAAERAGITDVEAAEVMVRPWGRR